MLKNNRPKITNQSKEFECFILEGKDKNFDERISSFANLLEAPISEIYTALFSLANPEALTENRKNSAYINFPFFFENSDLILDQFRLFTDESFPLLEKLMQHYQQLDFSNLHVLAIPSFQMFNGATFKIGDTICIGLGMDMIAAIYKNPEIFPGSYIYSDPTIIVVHEFTHAIHMLQSDVNINENSWTQLWGEGIAQLNCKLWKPDATLDEIFLERNLAQQHNIENTKRWAAEYLQDVRVLKLDMKEIYTKWFAMNKEAKSVPIRAGYSLGYSVVEFATQKWSIDEMLKKSSEEASCIVQEILERLQNH